MGAWLPVKNFHASRGFLPSPFQIQVASLLLSGFCDLLQRHTRGAKRLARFRFSWHNLVGTLACNPEGDVEVEVRWTALTDQFEHEVTSESRSALVFAVASASYTFLQQQVCSYSLEMVYRIQLYRYFS